jgi:DNA polymerase III sliding clamp (beta) subunit (PCNA family)
MVFDDIGLKLDEPVILNSADLKLALKNVKDTKDIEVKKIVKENKATDTFYQINGVNVRVIVGKYPVWQTAIPTKFEDTGKVTKSEIDNVIKKAEDEAFKAVKKQIISKEDIRDIDAGLFAEVLGASLTVKQRQSLNSLIDERFEEELDKIIKKQISKTYKESGMIIFNGDTITIKARSWKGNLLGGFEFKTPLKNKIKYLKNEDLKIGLDMKRFKEVIDSLGEENLDLSILSPTRPVVINNKAILMPIKVE